MVSREQESRPQERIEATAARTVVGVSAHLHHEPRREGRVEPREVLGTEGGAAHREGVGETRDRAWATSRDQWNYETPSRYPGRTFRVPACVVSEVPPPFQPYYCRAGSMISAKELRARFSRDFTVPRLQCVISAISSYDFPSSSRSTNTWR